MKKQLPWIGANPDVPCHLANADWQPVCGDTDRMAQLANCPEYVTCPACLEGKPLADGEE